MVKFMLKPKECIFIDENMKEEFKSFMRWTEKMWKAKTIELKDGKRNYVPKKLITKPHEFIEKKELMKVIDEAPILVSVGGIELNKNSKVKCIDKKELIKKLEELE